eukprot:scaffold2974_cov404-Prasinococcus_capsulatus_cf.AAC.7
MISLWAWVGLLLAADGALTPWSSQCGANIEALWGRLRHEGGLSALDPIWYDCSTEPTERGQWTCEYYLHGQLQKVLSLALQKADSRDTSEGLWAFTRHAASAASGQTGPERQPPQERVEWGVPIAAACDNLEDGARRSVSCWSAEQVRHIQAEAAAPVLPSGGGRGEQPLAVLLPYHKMGCVQWKHIVRTLVQEGAVTQLKRNGSNFEVPQRRQQLYDAADAPYVRGEGDSTSSRSKDRGSGAPPKPYFAPFGCSFTQHHLQHYLFPLLRRAHAVERAPVRVLVVLRHFADTMVRPSKAV